MKDWVGRSCDQCGSTAVTSQWVLTTNPRWASDPMDAARARLDTCVMTATARATMHAPDLGETGAARSSDPIITRSRHRELRVEVERLRYELNVEFAARLREARAFGEVANNDDYLQIKEEKEVLTSRIASLEAVLSSAAVIADDTRDRARVAIGAMVKVEDLSSGEIDEYLLIGDFEPPNPCAASAGSPVGRALIGRAVGDEVEIDLPNGRTRHLRIVSSRHST